MSIFEKWELFFAKKSTIFISDANAANPKNLQKIITASFFWTWVPQNKMSIYFRTIRTKKNAEKCRNLRM